MFENVQKTTIECYKIDDGKGITSTIALDGNRITINYGSHCWSYYWSAPGENGIKSFLTEISIEYVANKFNEDKQFDIDTTLKEIEEYINLEQDSNQRKILNKEVKILKNFLPTNIENFRYLFEKNEISNLFMYFNFCPPINYTISYAFKSFWETAWAAFILTLKEEIKNEVNS